MNKRIVLILASGLAAAATVVVSYAACFAQIYEPECVRPGDQYAQCTPQGCDQTTGLIATSFGYEYGQANTYPSGYPGGWQNRTDSGQKNTCYVGGCEVYNNCTHSYEYSPIPGCSCNFQVTKWLAAELEGCQ